jgi:hypothetical protein
MVLNGFARDLFGEKLARRRRAAWLGLSVRRFGSFHGKGFLVGCWLAIKLNFDAMNGRARPLLTGGKTTILFLFLSSFIFLPISLFHKLRPARGSSRVS